MFSKMRTNTDLQANADANRQLLGFTRADVMLLRESLIQHMGTIDMRAIQAPLQVPK